MSRLDALFFWWHRRVYDDHGGSCKTFPFQGFQTGSNVVLRGRRGRSWHSHVSADGVEGRFVWQVQYFCKVFGRWLSCFVACAALWTCPCSFLRGRRSTLDVSYCVFFVNHNVVLRVRFICVEKAAFWCRSVECGMSYCVAGAVFGPPYTLHCTLRTLHFPLSTPHSTTPHFTLYSSLHHTLHFMLHTLHSTLHT